MRRNHMEVIKHQRDETVHNGIRSTKHSLAGCIDCHASYEGGATPVPVDAEGQFCIACHEFAAVAMNCFGCHSSVPAVTKAEAQALGGGPGRHPPIAMSAAGDDGLKPAVQGEGDRP
jgi:hypothetical protein